MPKGPPTASAFGSHGRSAQGVPGPSMEIAPRRPRSTPLAWLTIIVAAVAVVDQLGVAMRFARHVVIEDQTIIWYAARELGQGHLREPHYTGQAYGSTLEAIPVEVLRWVGVAPSTALPLVLVSLSLTSWLLVAWVSFRRGRPVLALVAAAAPILLSTYYAQYVSFYGAGAGRFLAAVSLAVVVGWPDRPGALTIACAAGGLALVVDASSAILVGPVLVYAFLRSPVFHRIRIGLLGFLPAVIWLGFDRWFYSRHADYKLHPSVSSVDVSVLERTYSHPERYFGMIAPELARSWVVPALIATVLVLALLATRRWRFVSPAVTFLVAIALALSSAKALDGPSPLLPYARLFLIVPLTLWFMAFLVSESRILRRLRIVLPAVVAAVILLAGGTFVLRAATLGERNRALLDDAANAAFVFPVVRAHALDLRCRTMSRLANAERTDLVVFIGDRASAYGCGAAAYGSVRTLYPEYERRTWLLHDEAERTRTRVLVFGVQPTFCDQVVAFVTSCRLSSLSTPEEGLAATTTFASQSALKFLQDAGVRIRPFGDDCEPAKPDARCMKPG